MAEELLVETLSSEAIDAGWKLIGRFDEFDEQDLRVTDAFWRYIEEDKQWSLFVATPLVTEKGVLETALVLRKALYSLHDSERRGMMLSDLFPVAPTFPLVVALRQRYGTINQGRGGIVRRISVSRDEPFIYRLNKQPSLSTNTNGQRENIGVFSAPNAPESTNNA